MSTCSISGSVFEDHVLRGYLEDALGDHFGTRRCVTKISRQPFAYQTSSPLEEISVKLERGEITLLFKDLSPEAVRLTSGGVKPAFLTDAGREIDVYRHVLPRSDFGTPECYGAIVDHSIERYGLFLELVSGRDLWQVGEFETWRQAAKWLGRFHRFWSDCGDRGRLFTTGLQYDAAYYRVWMDRAIANVDASPSPFSLDERRLFLRIANRLEEVMDRLTALPTTLVHGDFFASNILVADDGADRRICPVDWELCGIGSGLLDLATLTAGKWTESQCESLAAAYASAYDPSAGAGRSDDCTYALACCRLHLAVRMLGWATDWQPPPDHRHNWMHEALHLGKQLGLTR